MLEISGLVFFDLLILDKKYVLKNNQASWVYFLFFSTLSFQTKYISYEQKIFLKPKFQKLVSIE